MKSNDVEEDGLYTEDGTVDIYNKKPANKLKTGKWKPCTFILGIESFFSFISIP